MLFLHARIYELDQRCLKKKMVTTDDRRRTRSARMGASFRTAQVPEVFMRV